MEEKLPNDRFEEFLKESFDGYTESPSDDLWSKIEGKLEPTAPVSPKYVSLRRWWIGAAAAVVLGLFVCQHLYFENRMDNLANELASEKTTPNPGEQTPHQPHDNQSATTTNGTAKADIELNETPAVSGGNFSRNETFSPAKSYKATNRISGDTGKLLSLDISSANSSEKMFVGSLLSNNNQAQEPTRPKEPEVNKTGSSYLPENASLAALPFRDCLIPTTTFLQPKSMLGLTTPKNQPPSRMSVGLKVMPMVNHEKTIAIKPSEPSQGNPPPKTFDDKTEVNGSSLALGATIEYKASKHWSAVAGLDWRKTNLTSTHQSEFKFKDGKHHHGGGHKHKHEFEYQLNTPTGVSSLELRVEEKDTTQTIPDDEKLAFEVKTSQSISYLSLPLAAKFALGKNRLRCYVKGGVAFNFLLDNGFNISEISSLNSHFKIRKEEPPTASKQNLQAVSLDYLVAAGLEYRLTKSLILHLEPTCMGNLTKRHKDERIESSSYLAGISGGVSVNF
jgi:hypothetical protein